MGTYIGQYSVYINLCEYIHNFTLNASLSGKIEMGTGMYQKFG
jgi:hypothetical protein